MGRRFRGRRIESWVLMFVSPHFVRKRAPTRRLASPFRERRGMDVLEKRGNDPSAGSPTETLLRLHLPLDDKVYSTSPRRPR